MSTLLRQDYAVISKHENGHWMVEVFWKREEPPTVNDPANHLKTFKPADSLDDALQWVEDWYQHAEVIVSR